MAYQRSDQNGRNLLKPDGHVLGKADTRADEAHFHERERCSCASSEDTLPLHQGRLGGIYILPARGVNGPFHCDSGCVHGFDQWLLVEKAVRTGRDY